MQSNEILEKAQLIYSYRKINGYLSLWTGDLPIAKKKEELFGVIEMVYILITVVVTWMHTFVKNTSNAIFKMYAIFCR